MKPVEQIIKELEGKSVTSVELVEACFKAIDEKDKEIYAFLRTYKDEALEQARASDTRREEGRSLSKLDGLPVALKDNISYQDHITSGASKILADYNAPYDATVVQKLKDAGAIIIGQTNMDEFAMGSSTENSAYGKTKNPLDVSRVPGGSSGGSAAAVAAEMVPLALGSDTGGSIRQPAAFCGVVGFKPTYGAVSRYGLFAMASSLDQIGTFAKTVEGAKAGFGAIKGFDRNDSTSQEDPTYLETKEKYKIGIPKQFLSKGLDKFIEDYLDETIAVLEEQGNEIVEVDIPLLDQSVAIYYLLMPAEVSANLARFDGIRFGLKTGGNVVKTRTEGFGDEVKRRIMLGTFALSAGYADAYYKRAQAARTALTNQVTEVFNQVDLILGPTTPELPFKLGAKSNDPLSMYLSDIYTIFVNLSGLPGISVPVGQVEEGGKGLSVGMQVVGKPWGDEQVFDLAQKIEENSK